MNILFLQTLKTSYRVAYCLTFTTNTYICIYMYTAHARSYPDHWDQFGLQCLPQGHFNRIIWSQALTNKLLVAEQLLCLLNHCDQMPLKMIMPVTMLITGFYF